MTILYDLQRVKNVLIARSDFTVGDPSSDAPVRVIGWDSHEDLLVTVIGHLSDAEALQQAVAHVREQRPGWFADAYTDPDFML